MLLDQSIRPEDATYNQCMIVNADNYNGAYCATKYLIDKNINKSHILQAVRSNSLLKTG